MTKLIIDSQEIEVPPTYTVFQACAAAGVEVPRFCYHERLSVAGNCRMCLVEIVGEPKPVASCARAVKDLRPGKDGAPPVINTRTPLVKKAREGVMEFLLINHPLDCPICDQGGECDLQDQAMAYGVDTARYAENKRAVEDKYIGPLVKTSMNRCIHCTRCVRFTTEVAGVGDLGATGRGEDMEITTYLESAMRSELQGNVIDLCPVGALTSKPQAFKVRSWELTKTPSFDVMDALGSAIRVDSRGREVLRILPRTNVKVNEEWISDKTRFAWEGLKRQRLDRPYIRKNGQLVAVGWAEALDAVAQKTLLTPADRTGALAGDLAAVEEMYALKALLQARGTAHVDCRTNGSKVHPRFGRASYLFNATIAGIDEADGLMILGANPRVEAPVLNARIRKRWLNGNFKIGLIGEKADLTYDYAHLGTDAAALAPFTSHARAPLSKQIWLIGEGALTRPDGTALLSQWAKATLSVGGVNDGWNGFSVLHTAASRVGGLDIGFVPQDNALDAAHMAAPGGIDLLFNLGADEIDIAPGAFVVYIGTHGDKGAQRADVILPGAAYTEKSGTYVNTEGRVQRSLRAVFPPGDAREDWAIIRALSARLNAPLPFDSLAQLRAAIAQEVPHLAQLDRIAPADAGAVEALASQGGHIAEDAIRNVIEDFYLTNPIARCSPALAACSRLALSQSHKAAA